MGEFDGRRIFATVGIKGGVGKSTIAAHLVAWLSRRDLDVAVLDADPQQAVSRMTSEIMPDIECMTALTADEVLDGLPELAGRHTFVVCDGAGGESEASRALLLRTDVAICPCGPSVLDLRALQETAHLVRQARSIRGGMPDALVVLNRMQIQTNVSRDVIETAPAIGLRVSRTIVRQRAAIADTVGQQCFIWDMGSAASDAAAEFDQLFEEVLHGSEEEDTAESRGSTDPGGVHRIDGDQAEAGA